MSDKHESCGCGCDGHDHGHEHNHDHGKCGCGGHAQAPQPIQFEKTQEEHDPVELLERNHDFPCDFLFKVVGFDGAGFEDDLLAALKDIFGDDHELCRYKSKTSSGGKYRSFSLEAPAKDGRHVLDIYEGLKKIPGLVMLV